MNEDTGHKDTGQEGLKAESGDKSDHAMDWEAQIGPGLLLSLICETLN
jgi:hypothetical protein